MCQFLVSNVFANKSKVFSLNIGVTFKLCLESLDLILSIF